MSKPCHVIGITGGVSTGKSTFAKLLRDLLSARFFDADASARQLVDEDPQVRATLREQFGAEIFSAHDDLNRSALRAIVFADQGKKRALEQILHPRIRRQWATEAEHSRKAGEFFLADIPLLYETEGETLCDRVVVVACSPEIQLQRLMVRTGLGSTEARAMIRAQMPLAEKISRADHLIWNNGPMTNLEAQVAIFARYLIWK